MPLKKDKIKRILFITLSNTGDAILTTPVLDVLAREFGRAEIDILLSPGVSDVFAGDKRISRTFEYKKNAGLTAKVDIIMTLRKRGYDLVIDLKNTAIPFFLPARYRTNILGRGGARCHKKDAHLSLVKRMGINTDNARLSVETDIESRKRALDLLGDYARTGGYAVINAGAKSHVKRWPAQSFAELADRIMAEIGIKVVLVGRDGGGFSNDDDRVVTNRLLGRMSGAALDLVGKTGIQELVHIVGGANVLITNDSAPLHIGSLVNTPTVALFGPTDERKYGPLAGGSIVMRRRLRCAPCEKAQCRRDYECLRGIGVNEVFEAVKRICGY